MPEKTEPRNLQPLIVEDLAVEFPGFLLKGLSFRVEPGQVTGYLGHNGAGKTTTLRLIMDMTRKQAGTVRIGDLDHVGDEKNFKKQIGYVPEESFFYGRMKIAELLAFVAGFHPGWDPAFASRLLRLFDLEAGKKLGQLSKGMRMKVSLILALAHQPDVLLLDEPTSGLDPRSRVEVLEILRRAAHEDGRAVLFSTHILSEVEKIADRVIIIDHGRLLVNELLCELRARQQRQAAWSLEQYYLELVS